VGDAGEDEHIGDAVRQVVEDFPAPAGLARRQRDHPVQHVQPQSHVAEQRGDDQQPRIFPARQKQTPAAPDATIDA
jgi:hypothetical protein